MKKVHQPRRAAGAPDGYASTTALDGYMVRILVSTGMTMTLVVYACSHDDALLETSFLSFVALLAAATAFGEAFAWGLCNIPTPGRPKPPHDDHPVAISLFPAVARAVEDALGIPRTETAQQQRRLAPSAPSAESAVRFTVRRAASFVVAVGLALVSLACFGVTIFGIVLGCIGGPLGGEALSWFMTAGVVPVGEPTFSGTRRSRGPWLAQPFLWVQDVRAQLSQSRLSGASAAATVRVNAAASTTKRRTSAATAQPRRTVVPTLSPDVAALADSLLEEQRQGSAADEPRAEAAALPSSALSAEAPTTKAAAENAADGAAAVADTGDRPADDGAASAEPERVVPSSPSDAGPTSPTQPQPAPSSHNAPGTSTQDAFVARCDALIAGAATAALDSNLLAGRNWVVFADAAGASPPVVYQKNSRQGGKAGYLVRVRPKAGGKVEACTAEPQRRPRPADRSPYCLDDVLVDLCRRIQARMPPPDYAAWTWEETWCAYANAADASLPVPSDLPSTAAPLQVELRKAKPTHHLASL